MGCNTIRDDEGRVMAIICSRDSRDKCKDCGRLCTKLCDFPLANGKTCDRKMCDDHSVNQSPEIDFCLIHSRIPWEVLQNGIVVCSRNMRLTRQSAFNKVENERRLNNANSTWEAKPAL